MPIALRFPIFQLIADLLVHQGLIGAVDPFADGLDFFGQWHLICIDRREIGHLRISNFSHACGQSLSALTAKFPMLRNNGFRALPGNKVFHRLHFSLSIGDKMVNRDHHGHTKTLEVFNVTAQVRTTGFHRLHILGAEICLRDTTIHFHRPHRGHQHDS